MVVDPSNMVAMPLPNGKVKNCASCYLMGAMLYRLKSCYWASGWMSFRTDTD